MPIQQVADAPSPCGDMKFSNSHNFGGLALDKLAGRGHNEGTRIRVEKLKNHELNKKQKLKKLKKRLDGAAQQHAAKAPRDNVAELEGLLGMQHAPEPRPTTKSGDKAAQPPVDSAADDTREQAGPQGPGKAEQRGKRRREQQQQEEVDHGHVSSPDRAWQQGHPTATQTEPQAHVRQQKKQPEAQQQQQQSGKPGKPVPRMQRLMAEAAQRKAEAHAAREAALQAKAEKQAQTAAAQKVRTQQKKRFFKRNRAGQPLMQYRIEKILKQLENEQQGA